MRSPTGLKEIQRLVGRLTSLSRFVPKLVERTRPIIKLLKKTTKFEWTDECKQNFLQLKTFLASPPVIQKPNTREPIIVYLVVSNEAVSSVLVQEIEMEERPVYFVSRVLHGRGGPISDGRKGYTSLGHYRTTDADVFPKSFGHS